jgi:hypothetical protein
MYFIKRFRLNGETTVVATNLTLDEAKAQSKDSVGAFWFDSYASTEFDNPNNYKQEANS